MSDSLNNNIPLILGSQSPRRRQLLEEAGFEFEVVLPSLDAEDIIGDDEDPRDAVKRLAYQKASDVALRVEHGIILACDTIAVLLDANPTLQCYANFNDRTNINGDIDFKMLDADASKKYGTILGKPENEDHARRMLKMLRGTTHYVYSGICLWERPDGSPQIGIDETRLYMESVSDELIEKYLQSGLWEGKAGAFGYQDELGWIHIEEGSESNVVGLPMELLCSMLKAMGRV
jgi:septum formation protein